MCFKNVTSTPHKYGWRGRASILLISARPIRQVACLRAISTLSVSVSVWEGGRLDLVADNAALANALADKEPAGDFGHHDRVHRCLFHRRLNNVFRIGKKISNQALLSFYPASGFTLGLFFLFYALSSNFQIRNTKSIIY